MEEEQEYDIKELIERVRRLETSKQTEAPSPSDEDAPRDRFIPANRARESGDYDLDEETQALFPEDAMQAILLNKCVSSLFRKYPEPSGGHLKSQCLDPDMLERISPIARKHDQKSADTQRNVLKTIRPLLFIMERSKDQLQREEINFEELAAALHQIYEAAEDTIKYTLHISGEIRLERRRQIIRDAKLPDRFISSCEELPSSDNSRLLGPEFVNEIKQHEESRLRGNILYGSRNAPQRSQGNGQSRGPRRGTSNWQRPRPAWAKSRDTPSFKKNSGPSPPPRD